MVDLVVVVAILIDLRLLFLLWLLVNLDVSPVDVFVLIGWWR